MTCVWLEERDQDLRICFFFMDQDGDLSLNSSLDLGPDWTDIDGWHATLPGVVPLDARSTEVTLTPLIELSRSAMSALGAALRA